MRVLMINSVCGIRSTGRICTDIAKMLTLRGDDCKVAYGREEVPSNLQRFAVRIGNDIGVKCHVAMARAFDNVGYGSKVATKKFLKWVDEYKPDIIHLHNLHGYYLHIELLFNYLKKKKIPVVWTLHDCWPLTGHCAHFDACGCDRWESGCYHCPQKACYPSSFFFDRSKANYLKKKELFTGLENMTIVTPSQWLANLVKRSFLREYPVRVMHNGIDLSVFQPQESDFRIRYGLQNKIIFLGAATSWGRAKGLYDFYQMNEIKAENEVIVLVGLTKEQISALPAGIVGVSRTNCAQELAEIYTAADVFINPTYQETFGLTNIEAQACGTPSVTYFTGGSPEGVPESNVVERGDVEALLRKARETVKSKRIMDVSNFAQETCFEKYIGLYHEIIG